MGGGPVRLRPGGGAYPAGAHKQDSGEQQNGGAGGGGAADHEGAAKNVRADAERRTSRSATTRGEGKENTRRKPKEEDSIRQNQRTQHLVPSKALGKEPQQKMLGQPQKQDFPNARRSRSLQKSPRHGPLRPVHALALLQHTTRTTPTRQS